MGAAEDTGLTTLSYGFMATDLSSALPAALGGTDPAPAGRIRAGTPAFLRTARAMFVAGFATFSMLYCMQPLMPHLSHEFGLSAGVASGVVSVATGALALTLIPVSVLADRYGRTAIMNASIFLSALFTLLAAWTDSFGQLLLLRTLMGVAAAGLPAVAMAYLAEEMEPASLGGAIGLYIAGNALGGMCGRFFMALMTEWVSWRVGVGLLGALGLLAALEFWRCLPPSRFFSPGRLTPRAVLGALRGHFSDAGLPWLFAVAFLLMGAFVSLYNYLGYRLAQAPYGLSPGQIGLVFLLYVVGMWSSTWGGRMADRFGRRTVLWRMVLLTGAGLLLTLFGPLPLVMAGVGLFTFGFFASHAVASSWVGRRALKARGLASALYLTAYYLGSSLVGSATGPVWTHHGWSGMVGVLGAILALSLLAGLKLRRLAPLPSGG